MKFSIKNFEKADLTQATEIWNEIITEANSFPGEKILTQEQAFQLFLDQTETVCAVCDGKIAGLYILHPNGFGRCGHIANASYAVKKEYRGKGIGKALVCDCIERARINGFLGLQFNAVVASNYSAVSLYLKLGFSIIGMIKNGFRLKDNTYCDTIIFLKSW